MSCTVDVIHGYGRTGQQDGEPLGREDGQRRAKRDDGTSTSRTKSLGVKTKGKAREIIAMIRYASLCLPRSRFLRSIKRLTGSAFIFTQPLRQGKDSATTKRTEASGVGGPGGQMDGIDMKPDQGPGLTRKVRKTTADGGESKCQDIFLSTYMAKPTGQGPQDHGNGEALCITTDDEKLRRFGGRSSTQDEYATASSKRCGGKLQGTAQYTHKLDSTVATKGSSSFSELLSADTPSNFILYQASATTPSRETINTAILLRVVRRSSGRPGQQERSLTTESSRLTPLGRGGKTTVCGASQTDELLPQGQKEICLGGAMRSGR
ncbi:hypothetical protein CF327_g4352 [Tilletia walkeri]|nr:hypothetical protein CF327_g4352 [Tilletia walkeri]